MKLPVLDLQALPVSKSTIGVTLKRKPVKAASYTEITVFDQYFGVGVSLPLKTEIRIPSSGILQLWSTYDVARLVEPLWPMKAPPNSKWDKDQSPWLMRWVSVPIHDTAESSAALLM